MIVRAARDDLEAALIEPARQGRGRSAITCPLYSRNSGRRASPNATALAAITCMSGPPCRSWEDGAVHLLGVVGVAQDHAAARTAQGLVGGGADDLGVAHRARVMPRGDETRDVRDVGEQQRADLVGDLAELREVDHARVGGRAALDQLRRCSFASAQLVVVDALALLGRRRRGRCCRACPRSSPGCRGSGARRGRGSWRGWCRRRRAPRCRRTGSPGSPSGAAR